MEQRTHTDKTLDALADLFLTDPGRPQGAGEAPAVAASSPSAGTAVRLPPKPAVAAVSKAADGDRPAVAGVISAGEAPARRPSAQTSHVEAVFLGNLPGFARPWLTQYAHHLAQRRGPVAVLHVCDDYVDAELVSTADDQSIPPHIEGAFDEQRDSSGEMLLDCLHDMSQLVQTWLVHLPVPPGQSAPKMALEMPRWTVLCGADDPAILGAYQLLKQLLSDDPHRGQRRLGLMVMGCDQQEGLAAARKLNSTTAGFLDAPVGLVGCLKQMLPTSQRVMGRFGAAAELWPSLRAFLETMAGQLFRAEPETGEDTPFCDASGGRPDLAASGAGGVERQPDPPPRPADPIAQTERARPSQVAQESQPSVAEEVERAPSEVETVDLSQYLSGAISLEARCPDHRHCQMAVDELGRLHLLYRCDEGGELGAVRAALMALIETRGWALQHLELLQLTQRQCKFDLAVEPALHLFTDRPKDAAALVRQGRSVLRLHLLRRLVVANQPVWFCTELN